MQKKYLPFLALLLAVVFYIWVKKNQQGGTGEPEHITIPAAEQNFPFNRKTVSISYSKHARCRMECRSIDEYEVKEIIAEGILNEARIREDKQGKTYPLEGITRDRQRVRIVVAPKDEQLVIVTVIDLENERACDCR